jgi:hypothetical protein
MIKVARTPPGVALELPDDWHISSDPKFSLSLLIAFRRGTSIDDATGGLSIETLALPPTMSLREWALEVMRRHVGQGYPEEFESTVGGRRALGFEWTSGVSSVVTWFIERPHGQVTRVEFSIWGRGVMWQEDARASGETIVATVSWLEK